MSFNVDSFVENLITGGNVFDSKNPITVVQSQGFGDFYFDTSEECNIDLTSEITDHYIEDGTVIQDHIVIKPVRISLSGFIGEYKYNKTLNVFNPVNKITAIVAPIVPDFSAAATEAISRVQNTINLASNVINRTAGLVGDFGNLLGITDKPQSKQSKAFIFFESALNAREVFKVITPYKTYESMAIESIKADQTEETGDMTNFVITFKEIRIAQTKIAKVKAKGATSIQKKPEVAKGTVKGTSVGLSPVSLF